MPVATSVTETTTDKNLDLDIVIVIVINDLSLRRNYKLYYTKSLTIKHRRNMINEFKRRPERRLRTAALNTFHKPDLEFIHILLIICLVFNLLLLYLC